MNRNDIEKKILEVFLNEFEIENPGMEDNLRDKHGFDSIDAIELLMEIEEFLGSELSRDEKEQAMEIRSVNDICDYVENLAKSRSLIS